MANAMVKSKATRYEPYYNICGKQDRKIYGLNDSKVFHKRNRSVIRHRIKDRQQCKSNIVFRTNPLDNNTVVMLIFISDAS